MEKRNKRKASNSREESDAPSAKRCKAFDDTDTSNAVKPSVELAIIPPAPGTRVPSDFRAKSAFPFLYLPTEMRFKIYGYLFKVNRPIHPLVHHRYEEVERNPKSRFQKGLVRAMVCTNKRLSKEVTHFIYSRNRFLLMTDRHRDWIDRIGKNACSLQEVIVVGRGPPKRAVKPLSAMLNTLRKRAHESLRFLTVHDQWHSLQTDFVVKQLLEAGKTYWKPFKRLEKITVDIPHHRVFPAREKPLYEDLCFRSKTSVTARYRVDSTRKMAFHPVLNGWYTVGNVWFQATFKEMAKRTEKAREGKKQIARQAKYDARKKKLEERARARKEGQMLRQQQDGQEGKRQESHAEKDGTVVG